MYKKKEKENVLCWVFYFKVYPFVMLQGINYGLNNINQKKTKIKIKEKYIIIMFYFPMYKNKREKKK